jgi:hypothetical protein
VKNREEAPCLSWQDGQVPAELPDGSGHQFVSSSKIQLLKIKNWVTISLNNPSFEL